MISIRLETEIHLLYNLEKPELYPPLLKLESKVMFACLSSYSMNTISQLVVLQQSG